MGLTIEVADPQKYKAELISLFTEHGVPNYPAFMESAYPAAAVAGSKHWIGLDEDQRVIMHMARFTHQFAWGSRVVRGGLLVNMMVDKNHRTFFPIMSIMRRVVADSKTDGGVDFLYTNPNDGGGAIIKAGGLRANVTLRRLTLPLRGRGLAGLAVRLYTAVFRLLSRGRKLAMAVHEARDMDTDALAMPARSDRVAPLHPRPWYTIWLPAYPSTTDKWFTFGDGTRTVGAVHVRRLDGAGAYRLLTVWRNSDVELGSLIWPVCAALRQNGGRRLFVWTIDESPFAAELRQLGFLGREDAQPFFTMPLTPAGEEVVGALPNWEITDFDCDR